MLKPEVPVNSLRGFGAFRTIIARGNVLLDKPLRLFYEFDGGQPSNIFVGFAVTRNLHRAVDRNHIKRLMRESFRLHQAVLTQQQTIKGELNLVVMYSGSKTKRPNMVHLQEISVSMHSLLCHVVSKVVT